MLLQWCAGRMRSPFVTVLFVAVIMALPRFDAFADTAGRIAECTSIKDDTERLRCYDRAAGRRTDEAPSQPDRAKKTEGPAGRNELAVVMDEKVPEESIMSRQWDLDRKTRKNRFVIRPYRSNYILPLAYNTSPNQDQGLDVDPNARAQNTEVKFQISFKVKLLEDIFRKDVDLWFAYTQLAFWQFYNKDFSAPFRETNYEPELLLNFRTNYDLFGLNGRIINVGFNHQSNGRSQPLSRSWNRIVANFGFERGRFNLLLKTWYRIPETAKDDDNPDINRYLGYGEIWGFYFWDKHRFGAMLRNNLRPSDNKGAVQLEWAFPLIEHVSGYIQYFNGYGESLIDYNKSVNRFSIGFMLTDWY